MSENEETNDGKLEDETLDANPQGVTDNSNEPVKRDTPSQPSSEKATILYGTRKRRPGAQAAPTAKTLDQIRGAYDDDDIIEMDDLPTRSTAPSALVEEDRAPERKRRERPERRERRSEARETDETSDEEEASPISEIEAYPSDEVSSASTESNRPKRFDEVDKTKRVGARQVEEFSPSKDGKRAAPKKRVRSEDRISSAPVPNEKRGFFAWLKSLFSSEPEQPEERKKRPPSNRKPNQRRQGGQNRRKGGAAQSERPGGNREGRRPRRNRRPRGEGGGSDGNRQGGNRQRRRRRPQGDRRETPSE